MKPSNISKAILLCQNGNENKGKEMLIEILQAESVGLILSKTRVSEKYDALSIFYDAILDQVDEIISESFAFIDDAKFKSYFKTKCVFKAKEFIRENISPFIPLDVISAQSEEILEIEYENISRKEYQRKNDMYGLDLSPDLSNSGLPKKVIVGFHKLSDKCKILIILKKLMNISHRKIVDTVGVLYTISNENVSKNILRRCWKMLVEQAN